MTTTEQDPATPPELRVTPDVQAHLHAVLMHPQGQFLGTSPDEIHGSFALLERFNYPGGMAAHLAGIEATSSTKNAAAVSARYNGYADKAWLDRFHLRQFGVELADYAGEASGRRLGEIGFQALQPADIVVQGGGQLIRYHDLSRIAAGELIGVSPFMPIPSRSRTAADPYTVADPEREMRLYMGSELGLLRLGEAQQLLLAAIDDQEARFGFWASRMRTPTHLSRLAILNATSQHRDA